MDEPPQPAQPDERGQPDQPDPPDQSGQQAEPRGPARRAQQAQPMQVDSLRVVAIGTAVWLLASIVLLPFWDWLGRHHHRIWLWTCLAGVIIGLLGSVLARRHRAQGRTD